ncbi:uncharacterized protein N7484_009494 [Penicillium longicatenatum]|uniref:uncharacterized protein n=1 Tax=Penicillium longicatenatum TaxID=1561947 RepID=UPI0025497012|nr:uncharacterized protein N7484_009494 [Penicillium longicatenatum]KAJ5636181.1 hypothetical protein N7484_009494 [Penicillium longicatenatum]
MPPKLRSSSSSAGTAKERYPAADKAVERGRDDRSVTKATTRTAGASPTKLKEDSPIKNIPPTHLLDVYVFGTNCYGELGLGDLTRKSELLRPVLNKKLDARNIGVVHIAVGGVHSAALTHDNQILTWGVNDEGALGRDVKQYGDEDAGDVDSGKSDVPSEATPLPVDPSYFGSGIVFSQLAASDSATFALTTDGLVYGWGTFRGANGGVGFSPLSKQEQRTPLLIPLHDVVKIDAGAQHVLALTSKGTVFSWGCDEQNQLGRCRASRHQPHPLEPKLCALPTGIRDIGVGLYHSFAIHKKGDVYAWGSNNFGQTGVTTSAGQNDAIVAYPNKVPGLKKYGLLVSISGGKDHSMAITEQGECLIWGRIDNKALGIALEDMPQADIIYDTYGRPRILKRPNLLTGVGDKITFGTAGTDHSFVITESGTAYSWGFNAQCQAGQPGLDEVERPTLLHSKYLEGKKLVSPAAGGQFSVVFAEHSTKDSCM